MAVGDERQDAAPGQALDHLDEAVLHRVLEVAAGPLDDGLLLQLDHRLLDIRVDPAQDADEQVVAEHLGAPCDGRAVVVALVQGHHRLGHGVQELITGQRHVAG